MVMLRDVIIDERNVILPIKSVKIPLWIYRKEIAGFEKIRQHNNTAAYKSNHALDVNL